GQPRISGQGMSFRVVEDSSHQVDLAIPQSCFLLDPALPNDRLSDIADGRVARRRGNFQRHLQGNFVFGMDVRCDVDVDSYIQILKLRIHSRSGADAAGREGPRRYWN